MTESQRRRIQDQIATIPRARRRSNLLSLSCAAVAPAAAAVCIQQGGRDDRGMKAYGADCREASATS